MHSQSWEPLDYTEGPSSWHFLFSEAKNTVKQKAPFPTEQYWFLAVGQERSVLFKKVHSLFQILDLDDSSHS